MNKGFLPVCRREMEERGWEYVDFVYVSDPPQNYGRLLVDLPDQVAIYHDRIIRPFPSG